MAISSSKKVREGGVRARRRVKMASLRRWVRRALVKGLTGRELVVELRVRRGLALRKVAKVLRVGLGEVREQWLESCEARAARAAPKAERVLPVMAPEPEGDFSGLRERVSVALWETVVTTFSVPEVTGEVEGEDEDAERAALPSPPMLSVRLKALGQMVELYDLGCKSRAASAGVVPVRYATREEIAELVRERMREESLRFEAGVGKV